MITLVGSVIDELPPPCVPGTSTSAVVEIMEEAEIAYLPVVDSYERRGPIGIVNLDQLRRLLDQDADDEDTTGISTRHVIPAPVLEQSAVAVRLWKSSMYRPLVLVGDERGRLVGGVDTRAGCPDTSTSREEDRPRVRPT